VSHPHGTRFWPIASRRSFINGLKKISFTREGPNKNSSNLSRKNVAKEKMFCMIRSVDLGSDRASPLKILLTEEGEIDQIFWLRFGKSYLVLGLVLFFRIESCFVVIG
jgi:hypothetical protein